MRKHDKKEELIDLENKWKRAMADYANLEKRIEKEKQDFVKFSNIILLEKLLDILDDLERCLLHCQDQGLKIIFDKFAKIIKDEGVEEIPVLGKNFDPNLMEAVETVPGTKGKVIEVLTKGYSVEGKVLRPAKVKVGGEKL